jgi:hypothetical protein
VVHELLLRIRRAAAARETFRVMVVLPLYPVAGGNADPERGGLTVNCIMHQQYTTIARGGRSLIELLRADGIDPSAHVRFFGLRTHGAQSIGVPSPVLDTEQVYVHSKLMIVDGRAALLGSANLNDRSLLGDRDSEVNVLVQDDDLDSTTCTGASTIATLDRTTDAHAGDGKGAPPAPRLGGSGFAATLQAQLLTEHLALDCAPPDEAAAVLADPASERGWSLIQTVGAANTRALDLAFRCVPADDITSFGQLEVLRQRRGNACRGLGSSASQLPSAASTATSRTNPGATLPFGGRCPASLPLPSLERPADRSQLRDACDCAGAPGASPASPPTPSDAPLSAVPTARVGHESAVGVSYSAANHPGATECWREPAAGALPGAFYDGLAAPLMFEVNVSALQDVRGHLCELPLHFLEREWLQPENPNSILRELIETLQ